MAWRGVFSPPLPSAGCARGDNEEARNFKTHRQGLSVFFVSVLVTVPSGFSVTFFSFDSTVPSLLTLVSSVLETVRSHPTVRNDNPKNAIAAKVISLRFMYLMKIIYAVAPGRHWGITLSRSKECG